MEFNVHQTKLEEEIVNIQKHQTAVVELPCKIGKGTVVWHFAVINAGARIGENCKIGHHCFIAKGAIIGDNVRIQNNVSVFDGVIIEDDVFIGPNVCFTNVRKPRATRKAKEFEVTRIKKGATLGANSTILCGVTIGEGAMVGCGAVVNKNVPANTLVVGSPARVIKTINPETD